MVVPVAVSVATRSGLSVSTIREFARAAEAARLDAFYLAESAADSFALCQAALSVTTTIPVGTAIANARMRHPVVTAMTAATLDELSYGRFRLGLGVSNRRFNEQVLGLPTVSPLSYIRDYVSRVRAAWRGTPTFDRPAVSPQLSIMLAALQPRMLALAGEIADSVVLSLTTRDSLPATIAAIASGAAAAGRSPDEVEIRCVLPCNFDAADAARRAGRGVVVGYARHRPSVHIFDERGHADRIPAIAAALERGDTAAAYDLVDDEVVDEYVLVGDPDRAAVRIAEYEAAGVDQVLLFPVSAGQEWHNSVRRTIEVAQGLTADRLPSTASAEKERIRS